MKQRTRENIAVFILPLLLLGVVGPFEIFVGNVREFSFSLSDFYFQIVGTFLGIFLVLYLSSLVLPQKVSQYVVSFTFACSTLFYLQMMFFNKELISQDGNGMNWDAYKGYSVINLVIWILVLCALTLLPLYAPKKCTKIMMYGSVFLSLLQVVALVALVTNYIGLEQEDTHYALAGEEQYKVGKDGNIIVFILDQTPNEVFESAMQDNETMEETFRDFTCYNNAECHYSYTFPSLTHILTGTEVDVTLSPDEWKKTAWETERTKAYYKTLQDRGYGCQFFSEGSAFGVLGSVGYLSDNFENVVKTEPKTDRALLYRIMIKSTLYRYAPYVLKPRLETNSRIFYDASFYPVENGIEYENVAFYEALKQEGLSYSDTHNLEYKIIHLEGVHGPRTTKADASYTEEGLYEDDKEPTPEETSKGLGIILSEYFIQLKQLGVYEDALIIVMADHGVLEVPQPIFYIKLPRQTQEELAVNSAPISYDDFQATILDCLGETKDGYGTSIFDWNEEDRRERESWFSDEGFMVFTYDGNRETLKQKIMANEYRTEGKETGWKHSW